MFTKVKKWFDNYWYYYKWPVIIGGFFVIILEICLVQCSSKEDYDVSIVYTGPHIFGVGEKVSLASAFIQLMDEDINGDGKKVADIIDLTAFSDEQIKEAIGTDADDATLIKYASYTIDNVKNSFAQVATKGDVSVCLLDEYWYNVLYNAGHLARLDEILGYRPDMLRDDYSVYLSELDIYEYFGDSFGKLPDDTIVCFRKMSVTSSFTGKNEANKMYDGAKLLLKRMLEFEAD